MRPFCQGVYHPENAGFFPLYIQDTSARPSRENNDGTRPIFRDQQAVIYLRMTNQPVKDMKLTQATDAEKQIKTQSGAALTGLQNNENCILNRPLVYAPLYVFEKKKKERGYGVTGADGSSMCRF